MKKMDNYNKDFEADFNDEADPEVEKIKPLKNLKNLISKIIFSLKNFYFLLHNYRELQGSD